jgi:hypothetical protein
MNLDIKILCDRCFEDVVKQETFYRKGYEFGSCTYCKECYEKIQKEFENEEPSIITSREFRKRLFEKDVRSLA